MQPEPNDKMEELLKRLAKERREKTGSDFDLHPATRQILQGEIARTFPRAVAKPLFFFWPRLALMGVFTALLALTLIVLNTPRKTKPAFELSQRSDQPGSPAPEPLPPATKEELVADKSADADGFSKKQIQPPLTVPLVTGGNSPQKLLSRERDEAAYGVRAEEKLPAPRGLLTNAENRSDQLADRKLALDSAKAEASVETGTTAPAIASRSLKPAPFPAAAPAQYFADTSSLARTKFVQQDLRAKFRENLLSPPTSRILQSFEVARNGNKIQFFDSDGSVYEGEILTQLDLLAGKKDIQNQASPPSEFAFRAAGTNQQLHRLVTISGNFALTNTNLVSNEKSKAKIADALKAGELKKELEPAGKETGSIRGKISIGGTNEFEMRAVELPR